MTKIVYKIIDKWGEVRGFKRGMDKTLTIEIDGEEKGYITVGKHTLPLYEGVASFDLSLLSDGEYHPLFTGKTSATLEPFMKCNFDIIPLPTPDKTVRLLLKRVEEAEKHIATLSKDVEELNSLVKGSTIF